MYSSAVRHHIALYVTGTCVQSFNPFRTAVPFWGQTTQISSSFVPKRDRGSKGVNVVVAGLASAERNIKRKIIGVPTWYQVCLLSHMQVD